MVFKLLVLKYCALIAGGHSLGKARLKISGFEHSRDESVDKADNLFLRQLQNEIYQSRENSIGNHQWYMESTNNDEFQGFNTDMSIVKQFEFNETTGEVTDACKIDSSSCSSNPDTASIIAEYIADDMKMANDFAKVFYKLLRKGYAEGDISEISHVQPYYTVDFLPASSSFIFDLFFVRVFCILFVGCCLIP